MLADGADEDLVAPRIRAILPPGLDAHPPASVTQLAKGTMTEVEWGLSLASVFAVVLAFIIIVNTFLMNASERRPQFAILRAVGATRRQIVGMMLREALLLGILGTLLGCGLGLAGGYLLMVAVTRLYVNAPPPVIFTPLPFVLALVLGPVLSLLAAAVPAWLTTRVTPLEAMQPAVAREGSGVPRWMPITGAGLLIVVGRPARGERPRLAAARGSRSCSARWPWRSSCSSFRPLVRPLAALAGGLLGPLGPSQVRLAQRQVVRRPVRNALTIGVVYVAMSIGIGLGSIITTTVGDVRTWYRQTLQGDFFLRTAFPNTTTGESVLVPDALEEEVRRIPGVTSVDTMRFFNTHVGRPRGGGRIARVPRPRAADCALPRRRARGPPPPAAGRSGDRHQAGPAVARRAGRRDRGRYDAARQAEAPRGRPGDRLHGRRRDHIHGAGDGRKALRHPGREHDRWSWPGRRASSAVHEALAQIARRDQLMLHSFADLSRMLDRMMGGVIGGLWAILALGFVVAAFGIANTLTMSVLEQTRELALLRVVAMTRRQVRRLVLAQAGIIGLIGLGLGVIAGMSTAYAISLSMMPLLGYPVDFLLHPWLLSGCLGFGHGASAPCRLGAGGEGGALWIC